MRWSVTPCPDVLFRFSLTGCLALLHFAIDGFMTAPSAVIAQQPDGTLPKSRTPVAIGGAWERHGRPFPGWP